MANSEAIGTRLHSLLRSALEDAILDLQETRFDRQNPAQFYAVCAYASVLEMASGCEVLLSTGRSTSLPILIRALLEQYGDLRAGIKDPDYWRSLYASFLKERLRLLRNTERASDNEYLAPLAAAVDSGQEADAICAELGDLERDGRIPLDAASRFKAADLEGEYRSMYWLLCLHGHNSLSSLEDRHVGADRWGRSRHTL